MKNNNIKNNNSKKKLLRKLQKSSEIAAKLTKTLGIICIIGILFMIAIGCIELISGKTLDASVKDGDGFFIIVEGNEISNVGSMIIALSEVIAEITIFCICSFIASGIFGRIAEDGVPFKKQNTKGLKTIGELIIIDCFGPSIIAALVGVILGIFSKTEFDYSIVLNLDLNILVVGLFFLMLTNIFSYGANLQQESDDTV